MPISSSSNRRGQNRSSASRDTSQVPSSAVARSRSDSTVSESGPHHTTSTGTSRRPRGGDPTTSGDAPPSQRRRLAPPGASDRPSSTSATRAGGPCSPAASRAASTDGKSRENGQPKTVFFALPTSSFFGVNTSTSRLDTRVTTTNRPPISSVTTLILRDGRECCLLPPKGPKLCVFV